MTRCVARWVVGMLLVVAGNLGAQEAAPTPWTLIYADPQETGVIRVQAAPPPGMQADADDPFTQTADAGGQAPAGQNPRVIGDLPGVFTLSALKMPGLSSPIITHVPAASSEFKIADNQSPVPEDRVFFSYNYYGAVQGPVIPAHPQTVNLQLLTFNFLTGKLTKSTETVTFNVRAVPPAEENINRETFGFEKTFLDGNASVGIRAPLVQSSGDGITGQNVFGDMSLFINYAFYLDRVNNNAISGGLMVTVPTGPAISAVDGNFRTALLQPFVGYEWNWNRTFVEGFTSISVPSDPRYVTALFNDVSFGYKLYRGQDDQLLSAVIPVLEVHVTTPLNHRNAMSTVEVPDIVDLTAGLHFGLGRRSMLTFGVGVPVTGPTPFSIEAIAQFNYQF